jgi:hypothetical protein
MRYHCKQPEGKRSLFVYCGIVLEDEYEGFRHAAKTGHTKIEPYLE